MVESTYPSHQRDAFVSRSLIGLTLLEVSCSIWSEGGIVLAQDDLVFLPSWCLSLIESVGGEEVLLQLLCALSFVFSGGGGDRFLGGRPR